MKTFRRADILLPQECDMTKWSVVACDQFTSQPDYWAALEQLCAGVPSTLHLMLPEAYLETRDQFAAATEINAVENNSRHIHPSLLRYLNIKPARFTSIQCFRMPVGLKEKTG